MAKAYTENRDLEHGELTTRVGQAAALLELLDMQAAAEAMYREYVSEQPEQLVVLMGSWLAAAGFKRHLTFATRFGGLARPRLGQRLSRPIRCFAAHRLGRMDELLRPLALYEQISAYPAVLQWRWNAYVHQT